jgi:phage repressor protein C with HTH and peptisase S24 domain
MSDPAGRLEEARAKAGFAGPTEAARAMGIKPSTYMGHENGQRGFRRESADLYARRFGVSLEWLLTGRGPRERKPSPRAEERRTVPLVGYVGAGALAHFTAAGALGEVTAPDWASDSTVAVEIRGESLGSLFDKWLVFYDEVRRPVTHDLVGKLCVVGLDDGRVLIKKIQRSRAKGLFHLLSQTEDPILDVGIEWAARVKSMMPQ